LTDQNELQVMRERLDVLIVLAASQMRRETEPKQILQALSGMGVSRPLMATVLSMTPAAVSKALERAGKAAKRASRPAKGKRGRRGKAR
jgi:hypothetical protein